MFSPVGLGVGGIFVAVALVYLLAYIDLHAAAAPERTEVRSTLTAAAVPLLLAFSAIVLFKSLQVL